MPRRYYLNAGELLAELKRRRLTITVTPETRVTSCGRVVEYQSFWVNGFITAELWEECRRHRTELLRLLGFGL